MTLDAASGLPPHARRPSPLLVTLGTMLAVLAGFVPSVADAAEPAAQVIRDADTGELRALTPEEYKALHEQQRAALKPGGPDEARLGVVSRTLMPKPQRLSNGARRVELDEKSLSYSVVTRRADGSLDMHCVTGANAADRLVHGGATPVQEVGHDDR